VVDEGNEITRKGKISNSYEQRPRLKKVACEKFEDRRLKQYLGGAVRKKKNDHPWTASKDDTRDYETLWGKVKYGYRFLHSNPDPLAHAQIQSKGPRR